MSVPVATLAQAWLRGSDVGIAQRSTEQLAALSESVSSSAVVRRFLSDPKRSLDNKMAALDKAGLAANVRDVTRWLVAGRRLHELPALVRFARRIVLRSGGQVPATVVSAVPIAEAERRSLVARLKQLAGANVALQETVEPSVLGGLIVTVAGRRRDLSLRGRIEGLRRAVAV